MPSFDPQRLVQASTGNSEQQTTGCLSKLFIRGCSFCFLRQISPINISMGLLRLPLTPRPSGLLGEINIKQSLIEVL